MFIKQARHYSRDIQALSFFRNTVADFFEFSAAVLRIFITGASIYWVEESA
jgi:hypothetical protein